MELSCGVSVHPSPVHYHYLHSALQLSILTRPQNISVFDSRRDVEIAIEGNRQLEVLTRSRIWVQDDPKAKSEKSRDID